VKLASLALARQRFDLTAKLLASLRWLFPDDPNPHFIYGQALASKGNLEAAVSALEDAARIAPADADIQKWLGFARRRVAKEQQDVGVRKVSVAHHVARSVLVLLGAVSGGQVTASVTTLHKLPGDVSLSFVLHGAVVEDQRRSGSGPVSGTAMPVSEDLRAAAERSVILSYGGEAMSVEQTVGDIPDPGVVIVIWYPAVPVRDGSGRPAFSPSPEECRRALMALVQKDAELAGRLDRHLRSGDASLKARLGLEGCPGSRIVSSRRTCGTRARTSAPYSPRTAGCSGCRYTG